MKIISKKKIARKQEDGKILFLFNKFSAGGDQPRLTYRLNGFISGSTVNYVNSIHPPGQVDKDIRCRVAQEEEETPFHHNLRQTVNNIR